MVKTHFHLLLACGTACTALGCDFSSDYGERTNPYDPDIPGGVSLQEIVHLTDESDALQPSWSPDGSRIVYQSGKRGEERIVVMNADGSNREVLPLLPGHTYEWSPQWSPVDNRIAYADGPDWNIGIRDIDATTDTMLTTDKNYRYPVWSPDGKKIACLGQPRNTTRAIWILDIDKGVLDNIYEDPALLWIVDWSSESDEIAFITTAEQGRSLYFINSETGAVAPFPVDGKIIFAEWTRDEERIIYTLFRNDRFEVWIANRDGSEAFTILTNQLEPALRQVLFVDLSQDGKSLLFEGSFIAPRAIFDRGSFTNIFTATID